MHGSGVPSLFRWREEGWREQGWRFRAQDLALAEGELKVFSYCGCAETSSGEGLEPLLDSEPRDESRMTFHSDVEISDGCPIFLCSVAREGDLNRH